MARRINEIARILISVGIGTNTRVAIFCEQGADATMSLLAILRVSATCILLDSRNSDERLANIITESEATIVVCNDATHARRDTVKGNHHVAVLNVSRIKGQAISSHVRDYQKSPDITMILVTSGTTGKAKGIILTHANLMTHITIMTSALGLKQATYQ